MSLADFDDVDDVDTSALALNVPTTRPVGRRLSDPQKGLFDESSPFPLREGSKDIPTKEFESEIRDRLILIEKKLDNAISAATGVPQAGRRPSTSSVAAFGRSGSGGVQIGALKKGPGRRRRSQVDVPTTIPGITNSPYKVDKSAEKEKERERGEKAARISGATTEVTPFKTDGSGSPWNTLRLTGIPSLITDGDGQPQNSSNSNTVTLAGPDIDPFQTLQSNRSNRSSISNSNNNNNNNSNGLQVPRGAWAVQFSSAKSEGSYHGGEELDERDLLADRIAKVALKKAEPEGGEVEEDEQQAASSSAASKFRKTLKRGQTRFGLEMQEKRKLVKSMMRKLGMERTIHYLQRSMDDPDALRGWRCVHGPAFNAVCSSVICLNAIFIGYSTSKVLEASSIGTTYDESDNSVVEGLFIAFFTLELMLRMWVERILFLFGPEWKWNMFDSILVFLSLLDVTLSVKSNLTVGRLLRIMRFARIARLTRVVRHFSSLRLVLFAILDSMSSLFWCFVLIGMTQFMFAVLFMSATAEYFDDNGATVAGEVPDQLRELYGDFWSTMVTLFMVISGGLDWRDAANPLKGIHVMYLPVMIFYVFLMQFGVLNVVVGTFVATATEIASKDREALVRSHMAQMDAYTQKIRNFFAEADTDKDGTLSWEELRDYLDDRRVQAYFASMDIDVGQAETLYTLLDVDGSGQVTIDEFLEGCVRFKGHAKSIDLNMLILMVRRLLREVRSFTSTSEDENEDELWGGGQDMQNLRSILA